MLTPVKINPGEMVYPVVELSFPQVEGGYWLI
jgi:hypothetical protein